jgi:peptidoglycan-N-acetylglucosamine deacetylase
LPRFRYRLLTAVLLAAATAAPAGVAGAASRFVSVVNSATCRDIAFTYDTEFGPATPELLDTLNTLNVRATWFLLGNQVEANRSLVRQIAARHEIGNHSYTHPEMTKLSRKSMLSEIQRAEAAIEEAAGVSPRPLFRPPYGDWNSTLLDVAGAAGYADTIYWTIDTRDWDKRSVAAIRSEITTRARPGAIVLMHGHFPNTNAATRLAVGDLRAEGYQFVTVSELLETAERARRDFGGDTYQVQRGDTWNAIGTCHNLTGDRLRAYNDAPADGAPTVGASLRVPHGDEVIIRLDGERQAAPAYPRKTPSGFFLVDSGLAEQLGAEREQAGGAVRLKLSGKEILITPGARIALVNGKPVDMGTEPAEVAGQLLLPSEFLAAQVGARLRWDPATYTLFISRPPQPLATPPSASPNPTGHGSNRVF